MFVQKRKYPYPSHRCESSAFRTPLSHYSCKDSLPQRHATRLRQVANVSLYDRSHSPYLHHEDELAQGPLNLTSLGPVAILPSRTDRDYASDFQEVARM